MPTSVNDVRLSEIDAIARDLASAGAVRRNGDGFDVSVDSRFGSAGQFRVTRGAAGAIVCSCNESDLHEDFRCLHMRAVRFAIRDKKSEMLARRVTDPRGANIVDIADAKARRIQRPPAAIDGAADAFDTSALDAVDPNWTHSIKEFKQLGNFFVVTAVVTVNGTSREGIGTGLAGDAGGIRTAERIALNQALAKFSKSAASAGFPSREPIRAFPSNPLARSLFDLVTAKQLGMIRTVARAAGVAADDECDRMMSCRTDELSKSAASIFIDHLCDLRDSNSHLVAAIRRAS